jgi:hypothetical protein
MFVLPQFMPIFSIGCNLVNRQRGLLTFTTNTINTMNRVFLRLVTASSLIGSALCLLIATPAMADPTSDPLLSEDAQVCVMSRHSRFNLVCQRVDTLKGQTEITKPVDLALDPQNSPHELKFSDAESNAALALFGCDCPACINALRGMRLMALG